MVQSLFSLWTGKMAKTKVEPLQVIEVEDIDENAKKGNIINDESNLSLNRQHFTLVCKNHNIVKIGLYHSVYIYATHLTF